jgi:F0F1-type ATP synthase assembly protein I
MPGPAQPQGPHDDGPHQVSPWALAGLGMQFAVALVGFGFLGQWLDQRFGTSPVFLLTGIFLGGGGTFYVSYRRLTAPRGRRTDRPVDGPR